MTQNSDFSPEQVDIIESIREKDGIPGVAAAITFIGFVRCEADCFNALR